MKAKTTILLLGLLVLACAMPVFAAPTQVEATAVKLLSVKENVSAYAENVGGTAVILYTVPANKKLIIKDVAGLRTSGVVSSAVLRDSANALASLSFGDFNVINFEGGVVADAGETVSVQMTSASSVYNITITGVLVNA